jgi:uncharacterized protein
VDRRAIPLLLASERFLKDDETEALDRLRMQKGVFLLMMRGPEDWREAFDFAPYDWGPYSSLLTKTVRDELAEGTLSSIHFEGFRFSEYRTTELGESVIAPIIDELDEKVVEFVAAVRSFVTRSSFSQLLKGVYSEYPEYATRSKFSG